MQASPGSVVTDVLLGRGAAEAIALVEADRSLRYEDLRRSVADRVEALALPARSLVVLTGPAGIEWVMTYLALLQDGHVPLLAGDHADRLAEAWQPDAVIEATATGFHVDRRPRDERRPSLHPDLALLLSTSGSTGSPKLVRLSQRNLESNADAIVEVLGLTEADCGVTSLPLHYCYGLSVLHSHLAAGARIATVAASVIDPCFAEAVRSAGV
ncbi:MAG: AMP-binding protein, partial [Aquihabitans sp.]